VTGAGLPCRLLRPSEAYAVLHKRDWRSLKAATFLVLGLSSESCSAGARFTVNEAIYRHVGTTFAPEGSGCMNVTLPGFAAK
jgi:hypothetical protein